ncbi:MAG: fumarylacetoacetase [Planctomycetes bacterium]|nr:fumarylacetoacetase [Planctomycetota bacterium]
MKTSWVESAQAKDCDFPLANLPWGCFTRADRSNGTRIGVAIGDQVFDVHEALGHGLLAELPASVQGALRECSLNAFMSLGVPQWKLARTHIAKLLSSEERSLQDHPKAGEIVLPASAVAMKLPAQIGDYTDFYASIHHATNVGKMFRPDNPLLPNWRHLPVGYHGRASSIVVSGTEFRRPMGQTSATDDGPPSFGPSKLLDYELEVGVYVGKGNAIGERIDIQRTREHLFGICLINDWSARDVQKWEYQPLGPFNAKNFATTVSPWIVTLDAVEPWFERGPVREKDAPANLPYLTWKDDFTFDLKLSVSILTASMREKKSAPFEISRGSYRDMYWTLAQMLAHHTSTGCPMNAGDLLGSGTVSGTTPESRGCMLERTWRGSEPLALPDGSTRKFLDDGDEVVIRGWLDAKNNLPRIGLGECRGQILAAK